MLFKTKSFHEQNGKTLSKDYKGDFLDETATPTVSDPDIAGECDIRVAEHICEPGKIGLSLGYESRNSTKSVYKFECGKNT